MKKLFIILLSAFSLTAFAQQKKVAVYVTGDEVEAKVLGSRLQTDITRSGKYTVIERNATFLAELKKEQSYQRTGAVDDEELSRLGKQFGVSLICVADIFSAFGESYVSARLIDVVSAEVLRTASASGSLQNLENMMAISSTIVGDLLTQVEEKTDRKKVAVYIAKSQSSEIGRVLGDKLVAGFTQSGQYTAVERTNSFLSQLNKEQKYQRTGEVDDNDISRLGKQFGVQYVCVAEVSDYHGDQKYIAARLVDVETAELVDAYDGGGSINSMNSCVRKANEIAGILSHTEVSINTNSHQTPSNNSKTISDNWNNSNNIYTPIKELYKKDPKWKDNPTITEECVVNVSIFHEAVKNKQFAEAYEPWWEVYTTCPNANKTIYTDGPKILEWKFEHSNSTSEKNKYAEILLELYDKRIFYFGNDPKYPTDYILGEKGVAYLDYYGSNKMREAYECLRQSVNGRDIKSKIMVLVKLMDVSYELYKQNPNGFSERFVADYERVSNILAAQANDPSNKNAGVAGKQKEYVDNIFAISGAADCSKLDGIYATAVRNNITNLDMLQKIAKLYKRVRCTESDVYFAACEAAHKLSPTHESAAGCASMAAKKGDYEQTIVYYDQAIKMAMRESAMEDVADYQYNAAFYSFNNLKKYPEARKYALASIATLNGIGVNKGQGRCYIIIGICYASTQLYGNDAKGRILNKVVYWAAVDKFTKAKQVDPTVEAQATELINIYSKYFPTKEERFDLPNEFSGSTFYVGGWIGETTYIR